MKKLTDKEINFIKETGWTPTVEQASEWDRTIFVNIFNKDEFKEKYTDEEGYLVDEFSNKVNEYVFETYGINTVDLYKKFTEESDGISLENEATYLFYTFFSKDELEKLTDEEATKWLKDFQYFFGYRKWDGGNINYVYEALDVYNGNRVFYLDDDGEVWNISKEECPNSWVWNQPERIFK